MAGPNFQPMVSGTNYSPYEKRAVQDTRGASNMKFIADQAMSAWEGYETARAEKEQQKVIDEYMTRRNAGQAFDESAAVFQSARDDMDMYALESGFSLEQRNQAVEPVEKEFTARLEKLKAAKDQGTMSAGEFADRLLAVSREAYNRTPGFADKIFAHTDRMLKLSGIKSVIDADAEAAKYQQKSMEDYQKNLFQEAKERNIPIPGGLTNPDLPALEEMIMKRRKEDQAVIVANQGFDLSNKQEAAFARQWGQQYGMHAAVGTERAAYDQAINILRGQGSFDQKKVAIAQMYDDMTSKLLKTARGLETSPQVTQAMQYLEKKRDYTLQLLQDLTTEEVATKALTNARQRLDDQSMIDFAQSNGVTVPILKLYNELLDTNTVASMVSAGQGGVIKDAFTTLIQGISGNLIQNKYKPAHGGVIPQIAVVDGLSKLASEGSPDAQKNLGSAIKAISTDSMNPAMFDNEESRLKFMDKLFSTLSSDANSPALTAMDDEARISANRSVSEYSDAVVSGMFKQMNQSGRETYLDVLPDGRLTARGEGASSSFVTNYITRINNAAKTAAALNGTNVEDEVVKMLDKHLQVKVPEPVTSTQAPAKETPRRRISDGVTPTSNEVESSIRSQEVKIREKEIKRQEAILNNPNSSPEEKKKAQEEIAFQQSRIRK